jgi:tight adherence protein B
MIRPVLLFLLSLLLFGVSLRLFYSGWRLADNERRIIARLGHLQLPRMTHKPSWKRLERAFLRAGLGRPTDRLGWWLALWTLVVLAGFAAGGWLGVLLLLLLPPAAVRLFLSWRYQRRLKRMIAQIPTLLDHAVRSLKSGRTLSDAVLGAIDAVEDPLKNAMGRIQRNVQLGVSLADAASDFAELYEKDELRMFALGLKVNHRYGGNASELLESLIKMIREREHASRELSAMTGETRITAIVLAVLPVVVAGYMLLTNPLYLLTMWHDSSGQVMLIFAFTLQMFGCLALWQMLRSL